MTPESVCLEWETTDGRRRRIRFEPATDADSQEASHVRISEAFHDDEGWLPVGSDQVAELRMDGVLEEQNEIAPTGANVFTGP